VVIFFIGGKRPDGARSGCALAPAFQCGSSID
jgi:hypothetical protein